MKRLLLLLQLFIFTATMLAEEKIKVELIAEMVTQTENIVVGDSTIVTLMLYSSAPVSKFTIKPEALHVKHAKVRPIKLRYYNNSSRVRKDGKIFYAMAAAQYVISPENRSTLTIPTLNVEATFYFRKTSNTPFADFFGYGGETIEVTQKAKSTSINIPIVDKPKRTTQEMQGSGLI